MFPSTYTQAIQVARERFNALNKLTVTDFYSFREYMQFYNTLWEQGMEMMNFARDIEDDMDLEDDCESIASGGCSDGEDDDTTHGDGEY